MQQNHPPKRKKPTARRNQERRAVAFVGDNRHPVLVRFGIAVRERRSQLGMTQEELATRTGISRSSISEIESGLENISLVRAERIASALDSTLPEFLKVL
ncbi:MAG: helix-turn-helix domain-containing protein [Anaerolineae bacterium]|nr:helix-turn-helix domain-containing protein [Anaerolineae bacterium]